ncbi:MAG: ABC transporter substrate-binding protein, partial [Eubacteriales bacterium]
AWNGGGFSVTANSDVKEEAIKLLNYMMEPDNWTKMAWENGVCMSAQNFADYLTGNETTLQMEWVNLVDTATSFGGNAINDLGTNEFKTVCEDSVMEFTIGSISAEEFFQRLTDTMTK